MKSLERIALDIEQHECGFEVCLECNHFVPGEGSQDARIVFVGEAPGADEDRLGRPFVGRAGALLDKLIAESGMLREDIFITNILKARPPGNRDPMPDEIAHHVPWLEAQLAVIEPDLIVTLGRFALSYFAPKMQLSEAHGVLLSTLPAIFPMYHPSAALHNPGLKATLYHDARSLSALLSLV